MTFGKQYSDWEIPVAWLFFISTIIVFATLLALNACVPRWATMIRMMVEGELEVQCTLDLIYRKLSNRVIEVVQLARAGAVGLTRV
jgi:hypothetical protein